MPDSAESAAVTAARGGGPSAPPTDLRAVTLTAANEARSSFPRVPGAKVSGTVTGSASSRGDKSGSARPTGTFADPGAAAVAAGVAFRDADGSVVFAPLPAVRHADPTRAFLQRDEDSPATTADLPPEVPDSLEPPDAGSETAPAAWNPPPQQARAGVGAAGLAAASHTDIEELARRLFDPLSAHLKAELRLDRERAGLVTDLRR